MRDTGNGSKYDVCLSFAGEQRDYVEQVADCLRRAGIRLFYDGYETAELWGVDLVERLDEVFRGQARFCVMFVSADYARKVWTTHERRSAQARAVESASTYILPVRFDQTEIPGLPGSVGCVSANELGPEQLADLIVEKVGRAGGHAPAATVHTRRVVTSQLFGMASVVGREQLLQALSDGFATPAQPSRAPAFRVLTGIGGMGKSSVARAYGARNPHRYDLIWWIRSETPELAVEDFRELLVALGVPDAHRLERPVQPAHVVLANRPNRWLLVFDNVPRQDALRGLVPPEGAGDVIVTSRTQSWTDPRVVLPVPPLSTEDGTALLRDTSRDDDPDAARTLVEELGGLPLALHQAGSYVAENPIGLAEYLRLYRVHRARLSRLGTAPDYDLRVGTAWEVSFQMIPENARTVLNVLAWLGPERVPLDLLRHTAPVDDIPPAVTDRVNAVFANELDFLEAVSALSSYGLITITDRDATVHRLISDAARDRIERPTTAPTGPAPAPRSCWPPFRHHPPTPARSKPGCGCTPTSNTTCAPPRCRKAC